MPQPTLEMLYRGKRGKSRAGIGHYAALDLKPHFAPLTVPFANEGCPPARGEQQQRKLKAELQLIFNAYIRKRDEGLPCISCGQIKPLQAGHYFPVQGYDGLRFNEFNVNGECAGCNCFDDAHLIHYGHNLIQKIGLEDYYGLRSDAIVYKQNGHKWSRSELIELIEVYKRKHGDPS